MTTTNGGASRGHASVHDVELVVLGSGTSAGVPVIGCDCAVCTSDDPRDRRLRCSSCLRFVDADGQSRLILFDTAPDLREQALRHRLRRCDAILFTHHHVDHVFGLDDVRRFNVLMRSSIDVYAEPRVLEALGRIYKHIFEREKNVNDSFVATLVPHVIAPEGVVDLHGIRVTPIRLLHGRLPLLGFRVEALDAAGDVAAEQPGPLPLAYCTDVSAIPPETWRHLTGLRTLLLDMLRPRQHPTHFTVDQAVAAAGQIGADRTWFIHMTHDIRHADLDPTLPEGMALAWDGLVLSG